MVARTTVTVFDDLDSTEGASTVTFAYKGTIYEIDLNEKNQAALDKALSKYVAAARKVGRTPGAGRRSSSNADKRSDLARIRTWAKANGFDVSDRGRISSEVQDAYDAAQEGHSAA